MSAEERVFFVPLAKSAPSQTASKISYENKLLFMHIPKTGGETFTYEIITQNFPSEKIYDDIKGTEDFKAFESLPLEEKEKFDCVAGHFFFGFHEQFASLCRYLCFVRHPVERMISTYYYTLNHPENYFHKAVSSLTLEEFIHSEKLLELDNYQTRLIAGQPIGKADGKTLETALKNIEEHFVCVGLTDQFDASLMMIAKLLNFENIYYSRWNKGRYQKALDPEILKKLKERPPQNSLLDLELYDFCKQRLQAQLAEHCLDEKAVLKYLYNNLEYQEIEIYEREQNLEDRQKTYDKGLASLNAIEAEFNQRVTEFNSLALVRLLRKLKHPFFKKT